MGSNSWLQRPGTISPCGWTIGRPISRVSNARVNVTVDGRAIEARAIDRTYTLEAPTLDTPGEHRLTFAVTRGDTVQTMTGTLGVAAAPTETQAGGFAWRPVLLALLAVGIVVGAALLWRARRRGAAVAVLVVGLLMPSNPISAHEGEDHSEEAKTPAASASQPASADPAGTGVSRAADGAVIALKPL